MIYALSILLYAAVVPILKLTAHLYRRTRISWKSAFGYWVFVEAIALLVTRVLSIVLPFASAWPAGIAISIAAGAWFIVSTATDALGQPVGFKPALLLSVIVVGMSMLLRFLFFMLFMALFARL